MKHPFQKLITNSTGEILFATVTNSLYAFRLADGALIGSWTDTVKLQDVQENKFKSEDQPNKKAKTNKKEPKVPVPGPGAPTIYNYIRSLVLTRNEQYIIGTTDSDKAAVIFKIDTANDNCLSLVKRQVFPKRPCAISTTFDDSQLIVADKFGDVYSILIDEEAPVDEKSLQPILGHVSMLSDVLVSKHENKQYILTGDRDEHIRVTNYPKSYVAKQWLFGHSEFVSCLHIPSFNTDLLISGGGDDYLALWNWYTGERLATVDLRTHIEPHLSDFHLPPERFRNEDSKREISIAKVETFKIGQQNILAVLCEHTNCIITFVIEEDLTINHKQTFTTENLLIDFAVSKDKLVASVDVESDSGLLSILQFNEENLLHNVNTDVVDTISKASTCEVDTRDQFYPLYYISSLRKRSDH
ncbi:hypothetical protein FT663_03861 [Candidozyma haemuli var. vulneris]|uniref:Uncharacterized protein n=1 Tax=Candidozyma haemuli TaxID=45357 RepID=A0A2V1AZG8_9ASCO|nr:hypothetical protein CXQ85_002631 [[Candida] haemuloni]KAF3988773.1 hypothetical protein FT662_03223 [[Candida] haemuloni var. vulneris]KAF3988888.1 hypothetical protein FT663_03861 [[Candida] haemuloni var. vulneris]PVH22906.1 hypothetical protein CXQ85_002631 [[Candida] haemuloni]